MISVILKAGISSFLATLGFAVLFNIKKERLLIAGLTGAIGGILYKFGIYCGLGEYISNFIAAIGLSFFSEIFARKYKTPVITFLVCALIPLVPGGYLYKMIHYIISDFLIQAIAHGVTTIAIAMVLAIGILIVSTLFQIITKIRR